MATEGWGADPDLGDPEGEGVEGPPEMPAGDAPGPSPVGDRPGDDWPTIDPDPRTGPAPGSEPGPTPTGTVAEPASTAPARAPAIVARGGPAEPPRLPRDAPARRLFEEGYNFDFFQAVRLLQRMDPSRAKVGHAGPPSAEAVRFRARISLSFPPSSIYKIERPAGGPGVPEMVQAFMGLTGPNGILPRHYTELLHKIDRDAKTPEKYALRDWFDLFNHRIVSLFYRAWEKYRFYIPYERGDYRGDEPDPFTNALLSLIGLGMPSLRGRLRVVAKDDGAEADGASGRVLARIEDLVLVHYGGLLGHRPRCAVALQAMLGDYFRVPTRVEQFRGQWLKIEPPSRTRLGGSIGNNEVGVSAVAGSRVWDHQSKFRIRLGPMGYDRFVEFLPDRGPNRHRKTFFLLAHLVRLYADPGLDFDVQVVLKAEDVPRCRLGGVGLGAHLGWNTWLLTRPATRDAEDVVIDGAQALACDPK